ncbi:MAG: class I SAM-dependent methyltransferase [Clostridium sp.]|nr:class I SAM-dependent methyltransferase [Clostridium sp.]
MKCILCSGKTEDFNIYRDKQYKRCIKCSSIMMEEKYYLNSKEEKERYEEHNNDVYDERYQAFVYPIVREVLKDYGKKDKGLDFGSGTGPVITKLLRDNDYSIDIYDPFFANDKEKLNEKYDYIVCCEVMEHFHDPKFEFRRLKSMLNPSGALYLKTEIYDETTDFDSWNYKSDPTHVFFYHRKALEYIKNEYKFSELEIKKDVIIYRV